MAPMYELTYIGCGMKLPTEGFMDRASLFLKLQYAADILLWTTLWSVKFSLLFFFWKLFESVNSSMRLFWWVMCGVTASTWIISVVLQEFACDPIRDFFTLGALMEAIKIGRAKDQDATVQKTKPTQLQMIYQIPILSVIRDQNSG
ncbi:hypothetical protein PENSUB_11674 [Penicillium subrubescens]|uniref:Rhodopsin domain-containing protein n=1 Tax=Penicillium subrubescens TaxID=1316194 RepID=A0A1Q5T2D2_9EURO|nr:hypothetical protein PENSUB_11674 [Penicillium subrubescens]